MADINSVSATSVFDQINKKNQTSSTTTQAESDSQMFMQLMIAQLQNQDPSSPADTSSFMQQISNMTMVESITGLASTMSDLSESLTTSQAALQASSMVGQTAFVKTEDATLYAGKPVEGAYLLDTSASDVVVSVYNSAGQLVDKWSEGAQVTGDHNFSWSGGNNLPGDYRVVVQAKTSDGKSTTVDSFIGHTVNSVTLGQQGVGMSVNTNAGAFSVSDIIQLG